MGTFGFCHSPLALGTVSPDGWRSHSVAGWLAALSMAPLVLVVQHSLPLSRTALLLVFLAK